ncbi:MAG: RluA family pseudouridine synthase [Clostridia bacterium]|nr:RluA family pseudouridine synthase [Clostridia bacterium]
MICYRGIQILHCDNHLLAAIKPPNMPSQADASGDPDMLTVMRDYIQEAYGKPGKAFLGLIHRLDRPVGGVMAFARTSKAAARLSKQFRERTAERMYLATVRGTPENEATLDGVVDGRDAVLAYRCIDRRPPLALLEVCLETGRKHQIRIQLSASGLPIYGDARYGGGIPGQQIALWAARITLTHPTLHERMTFEAPLPQTEPWTYWRNR